VTLMLSEREIVRHDSDGLAWVWAVGDDPIHYGGDVWEWDQRFDEWVGSMLAYLDTWQPPVLREHDRGGVTLGCVRRGRVLTRDEAQAMGIPQTHARALYLGIEWNAIGRALDDTGAVQYVSIGADFNWTDEDGTRHPAVLKELSVVSVPHLKRGQAERGELRHITLAEEVRMNAPDESEMKDGEAPATEGAKMMDDEMLAQIAAMIDERIAAALSGVEMREQPAKPSEPAEVMRLREDYDRLAREFAMEKARADVLRLRESHVIDDAEVDELAKLRLRDEVAYGMVTSRLQARPTETPRKAMAATGEDVRTLSLGERARALMQSEGCTFSEAWERVNAPEVK